MPQPEVGDPLEEIAEQIVEKTVKSSPWLVLSLLFHGAIFSVLPLIVFCDQLRESESTPVTIGVDAMRIDPERSYKPVAAGPPSAFGEGLPEPPIHFPDATPAGRHESNDPALEDRATISGESLAALDHLTDAGIPGTFRGRLLSGPPGTNDVMGVGGGSGSGGFRYGGSLGGRRRLVALGGGSAATEHAVHMGLVWLARHQRVEGYWLTIGDTPGCGCTLDGHMDECEVGVTALAALAYLGAGYRPDGHGSDGRDPLTGNALDFHATLDGALRWLEKGQEPSGQFHTGSGTTNSIAPMYDQAFATLAFCEAYRLTRGPQYKKIAERALGWLEGARQYTGGWRYHAGAPESDLSVTGACVQALCGALRAGLPVSEKARAGVAAFLGSVTEPDGRAAYMVQSGQRQRLGASIPAIGIYVRRFVAPEPDPKLAFVARLVERNVTDKTGYDWAERPGFGTDFYCWYYAMLSLFEAEGPRGAEFRTVNGYVTRQLCAKQAKEGCANGSWAAGEDAYLQMGGGRAGATALNVLTLEVYYRYASTDAVAPVDSKR